MVCWRVRITLAKGRIGNEGELERTDCEVDVVVSENKAKAESRSESAVRPIEGKAEADASARRMGS